MPIIILSNKGNALLTTDSCPAVKGSKEPGKIAQLLSLSIFRNFRPRIF